MEASFAQKRFLELMASQSFLLLSLLLLLRNLCRLNDVGVTVGAAIATRLAGLAARELLQARKHVQSMVQLSSSFPFEHLGPLFEVVDLPIFYAKVQSHET